MPTVVDFMSRKILTTKPTKSIYAASKLMAENNVGCLVVVDTKGPVGIVTERDLLRKVLAKNLPPAKTTVGEVMSMSLITVKPSTSIREVARLMIKNEVRRLPVVDEEKLVGIITVVDLAKSILGAMAMQA